MSGSREMEKYRDVDIDQYKAGAKDITDAFLAEAVTFTKAMGTLLIYSNVDAYVICNGLTEEIFCPAEMWLPLGMMVSTFNIKAATAAATGKAHYIGWY